MSATRPDTDAYRRDACAPKWRLAERLARTACARNPAERPDPAAMLRVAGALERLALRVDDVVDDVHDLWSEAAFRRGLRLGPRTDRAAGVHALLKPYGAFSPAERRFERALVATDMLALGEAIRARVRADRGERDDRAGSRADGQELCVLACLLADDAFLEDAARRLHESFAAARRAHPIPGDPASSGLRAFDGLLCEERRVALDNARSDLYAVAIDVARRRGGAVVTSPGRGLLEACPRRAPRR